MTAIPTRWPMICWLTGRHLHAGAGGQRDRRIGYVAPYRRGGTDPRRLSVDEGDQQQRAVAVPASRRSGTRGLTENDAFTIDTQLGNRCVCRGREGRPEIVRRESASAVQRPLTHRLRRT